MVDKLRLGPLGSFDAISLVECESCCYTRPEFIVPEIENHYPVINGTHMINGTIVVPVTKHNSLGYGYHFNDTDNTISFILPSPRSIGLNRVYSYRSSSTTKLRASMFVGSLMLINIILHSF